jgi:hypothetical protein
MLVKVRRKFVDIGIDNGAVDSLMGGKEHYFRTDLAIKDERLPEETRCDLEAAVKEFKGLGGK